MHQVMDRQASFSWHHHRWATLEELQVQQPKAYTLWLSQEADVLTVTAESVSGEALDRWEQTTRESLPRGCIRSAANLPER